MEKHPPRIYSRLWTNNGRCSGTKQRCRFGRVIDKPISSTVSYAHLSTFFRKFKIKGTCRNTVYLGDLLIYMVDCLKAAYALFSEMWNDLQRQLTHIAPTGTAQRLLWSAEWSANVELTPGGKRSQRIIRVKRYRLGLTGFLDLP